MKYKTLISNAHAQMIEYKKLADDHLEMLTVIYDAGQLKRCPYCKEKFSMVGVHDEKVHIIHKSDCEFLLRVNKLHQPK